MSDGEAGRFLTRHPGVRAFSQPRRPGFADCAPSGRVRLDALACWLQDVAYADVHDAGVDQAAVWVVRRTRIRVNRFPRFGQEFALTTFCSGIGRMWAERRTDIVDAGAGGVPDVEAVSLWVHLDAEHWRPSPLTQAEMDVYGGMPPRRVSARLRHPGPDLAADSSEWRFRATECDIADHVNNAAYWQPLEEELLAGDDPEHIDVEIEYRAPAQPGAKRVVAAGNYRWIVGDEDELHASIRLGPPDDGSI
ncbi:MAG TPA: acyl-ACP thioesterase domain-containing protein [Solirubrobacteraceae bacterium]|nr:acyl-ACP thioesterase domain-containing protein [Solirubrobacteraceae bacterium]